MLRANPQTHQPRGNTAQDWKVLQEFERQWEPLDGGFSAQGGENETLVSKNLESLRHASREFAAFLDLVKAVINCAVA